MKGQGRRNESLKEEEMQCSPATCSILPQAIVSERKESFSLRYAKRESKLRMETEIDYGV